MLSGSSSLNNPIPDASAVGAVPNPFNITRNVFWWHPIGGTTISPGIGGAVGGSTTLSTAVTFGSATISKFRRALSTTTAAINQPSGIFQTYARYSRADNGGFDAQFIFAVEGTHAAGHGVFCGFSPSVAAATTADITTFINCIGVGFTAADAAGANWSIVSNDGSGAATMTPITGMARSNLSIYRMRILCLASATSDFTISVFNHLTGAVILAPTVVSSNIPAANAAIAPQLIGYTGASTTALVTSLANIYIETNS